MEIFKNQDFNLRDDEYLKDGVIYCKNCNTPRQCFVDVGKNISFRCLCKCQTEKRNQDDEQKELEKRIEYLKNLKRNSLLGKRYENSTFDTVDKKRPESFLNAVKRCQDFCNNWEQIKDKGLGIYIYGNYGTGKTELAACIINELLSKYVPCMITNFLEISKRIRSSYSNEYETEESIIRQFANIDLLILDDVGVEYLRKSDCDYSFMQEKIFDIINYRYINKKPTVFTSNYSIEQLLTERGMHKRTCERVADMSNAVFKLDGESYRSSKKHN